MPRFASLRGTVGVLASDGNLVVADTEVFRRSTGGHLRTLPGGEIRAALLDGDIVRLVEQRGGVLTAFHLHDGAYLSSLPRLGDVKDIRAWSSGSERGIVAGGASTLFTTLDPGHRQRTVFGLRRRHQTFDVHGTTVAIAYEGPYRRPGDVRVFDCLTGKKRPVDPDGHTDAIFAVRLDEDGLVTAGRDGTVRAYDPAFRFVRAVSLPGGDYVRAFASGEHDPRVVHAMTSTGAMRLDRGTLEVIDHQPIDSPKAALSVDTLGRLVGVEGGIESLEPFRIAEPDPLAPDVRASYEVSGFFDKDSGWVAEGIEISQDGRRVTVRRWAERNVRRGRIERVEADRAHIVMDDGGALTFDLVLRRLV